MSSAPARTLSDSSQHADTLRKRVGKACDRCRLKKSKCDGTSPCSRCRADNAICVFGERKKAHDKVYPKGYVEMLEQQQSQLVAGLQETYRRLLAANLWPGQVLDEHEGHPLTHDILSALDILQHKSDGSMDVFEEDTEKLQQRLVAHGAPYMHRRGSVSSDSDHSTTHSHKRPRSMIDSPVSSPAQSAFRKSFDHDRATASPVSAHPAQLPNKSRHPHKPSPLHTESPVIDNLQNMEEDALMSAWSWQDMPAEGMPSQEPQFTFPQNQNFNMLDTWSGLGPQGFDPTFMGQYPTGMPTDLNFTSMQQLQKEPMDLDLSRYMPVAS
ncbi:Fungal Zn(2)-Cys(6) binuclear cluster domain-containing protein 1 [Elsinoe fawcettii]|nr:Fungal Zn(2)-Cys(6) binuclear cluster domain-containing protein 1 [Elsinoe fawcettii]